MVDYINQQEAASLTVTTAMDVVDQYDGLISIREAIAYAKSLGGVQTISFNMSDGDDVTISDPDLIYHDLRFASTNAATGNEVTVTLDNLSISGRSCSSEGNILSVSGGSILHTEDANIIISGGTYTGNQITGRYGWGGVIRMLGGTLTIDSTIFDSNSSGDGGGSVACAGLNIVTIRNTHFENNTASLGGAGAVMLWELQKAYFVDTDFVNNSALENIYINGGGAIHLYSADLVYEVTAGKTITNVNNDATEGGFIALTGDWASAEFKVNGTLLIGNGNGKDSIASQDSLSQKSIRKTGSGTMTINAPTSEYDGQWIIEDGILSFAYASGGDFDGEITISGGQMNLESKYTFNKLTFQLGDTINAMAYISNIANLTGGSFIVNADATTIGTYKLAGNAESFNSAISLVVGGKTYQNVLTVGNRFKTNGKEYALAVNESNELTFAIAILEDHETIPPDTNTPTVKNVKASITTPTNQSVTITASFSDDVALAAALYRIGANGEWKSYGNGVTVSRNTTVYFQAIDTSGNESEIVSFTVSNIENTSFQNIYFLTSYSTSTTGSIYSETGEELSYGINAFSVLSEAVNAAEDGANLYINGYSGDLNVPKNVNIHLYDSNIPAVGVGFSDEDMSTAGDIHVVIQNSTVATNYSYVGGNIGLHKGDIDVLICESTVGDGKSTQEFRLVNDFAFTGEAQNVSLTIRDSVIRDDINLLSNSTIGSVEHPAIITVTMDHVTVPKDKWFWITDSRQSNSSYADVVFNLSDSTFGNNNTMAISAGHLYACPNALIGDVTYNINNIQFNGYLYPLRPSSYIHKPSSNTGNYSLNVTGGSNFIDSIKGFDLINIAVDSVLSTNHFDNNLVLNVSGELYGSVFRIRELHLSKNGVISGRIILDSNYSSSAEEGSLIVFDLMDENPWQEGSTSSKSPGYINNLSCIQGNPDYLLKLSDTQASGIYILAGYADGFDQVISVQNSEGEFLGTLSVGQKTTLGETDYELKLIDNQLVLVCGDSSLPERDPRLVVTTAKDIVDDSDGVISLSEALSVASELGGTQYIYFHVEGSDIIETTAGNLINQNIVFQGQNEATGNEITLAIRNSEMSGKTVDSNGSAIVGQLNLDIEGVTGANNTTRGDGGILSMSDSTISIRDSLFTGNSTPGPEHGGAVAFFHNCIVDVSDCTFRGNYSYHGGGSLYFAYGTYGTVRNCTFDKNNVTGYGGAVKIRNAEAIIVDSVFTNNYSRYSDYYRWGGGAIQVEYGLLTIKVSAGKNIVNTGNHGSYGGFLTIDRGFVTFDVEADASLVFGTGTQGADYDSFSTNFSKETGDGSITKTGKGVMTMNAATSLFMGDWLVEDGTLNMNYGGRFDGVITITGGRMNFSKDYTFTKLIIELDEAHDEAYIGGINYLSGGSFNVMIDTALSNGTYVLADGATGFNRTISISVQEKTVGITQSLAVGQSAIINNTAYLLKLEGDSLVLSVSGGGEDTPISRVEPQKQVWEKTEGATQYIVELSTDDGHAVQLVVDSNSLDSFQMPAGNYQMRVKPEGGEWSNSMPVVATEVNLEPKLVKSNEDGNADVFFAIAAGTWESGYVAHHIGSIGDWGGTDECVTLYGKNKLADIIEGSTDANILLMTDDDNGDTLFVDDVYTASPGSIAEKQARIAQIDEIRAGAGDDIVDMTSQRFKYIGDGLTIRGGDGNDVLWANTGDNKLFGDAGNDRIVGASGDDVIAGGIGNDRMHGGGGNDVFTFCDNWGSDNVEQLSGGSVTLWFVSGSETNWNESTLTYSDGTNSVRVSGVSEVTLKFGDDGSDQFATLSGMGAFFDATTERIFEESSKGILASL